MMLPKALSLSWSAFMGSGGDDFCLIYLVTYYDLDGRYMFMENKNV